jgi:hypothetical protein
MFTSKYLKKSPVVKAPMSYITPEGCVQLPKFVLNALGLPNGGGVVFHTTNEEGQVMILSNEAACKLLGEEEAK